MAERRFGGTVIRELSELRRTTVDTDTRIAIGRALAFLRTRLTDAAKAGCHHCGEGEKGSPCWWCGLKN